MIRRLLTLPLVAALVLLPLAGGAKDAKPPKPVKPAAAEQSSGGPGMNFTDQKSGSPIEVYADQGLELSQDAKTVIGRVNAMAIRGNVTLKGDVLIAHYRPKNAAPADSASRQPKPGQAAKPGQPASAAPAAAKPMAAATPATTPTAGAPGATAAPGQKAAKGDNPDDGGGNNEIWRVEAIGNVTISTPTQTAYGDRADYNIDDAVVVLTGNNLRLITPTDTVTARDSLEYWEQRQQAVARGNAVAVRADRRMQADVLVADFAENEQKQMGIERAHGYDHVILTTPREVVTGDRGDYNVPTGIVIITGSVKMTREDNQLNGGYAVVNLNTGISRVFPAAPGAVPVEPRVRGLFVPKKTPAADTNATDGAATGGKAR